MEKERVLDIGKKELWKLDAPELGDTRVDIDREIVVGGSCCRDDNDDPGRLKLLYVNGIEGVVDVAVVVAISISDAYLDASIPDI